MSRFVLEELSDFGDYTGIQELADELNLPNNEHKSSLSNVRVSPDGRHVHIILCKPKVGLVTFDKHERPQLAQNQKRLDLCLTPAVPIVDIVYLDQYTRSGSGVTDAAVVAVVYENGKAEFWKFQECRAGWHLLQTSDLCNSPRARVVSVCGCSNLLIWCEERPPSESSPALSSTRSKLRFCVCRRDFEVEEGAVSMGGVKIILHNNPKFTVISSGKYVHFLPDLSVKPLMISKCFLSWSPHHDSFTVSTTCKNTPIKKLSAKESDLKRLVADCIGYLSVLEPPEIRNVSPAGCGGLLLLLNTGWLCLLQKDGTLRQVYKLAENCLAEYGTHTSLCVYQNTAALVVGQTLHVIDLNSGRELEKMMLEREVLLYAIRTERHIPHLLSETGLFVLVNKDSDSKDCNSKMRPPVDPGALLVEAVFEEACKYYQQRSLSSTQLTVDTIKKGGRFQAPISLASILRDNLSTGVKQKGTELSQNGGGQRVVGQDKLTGSLEAELRALFSLEEVKGSLVRGSVKEVEAVCENLVEKEVVRLLSSSELDKEALLYLNSIFSIFPCQAWRAAQAALQLHYNGEGSLTSRVPPDVWKTVLSPTPNPGTASSHLYAKVQPKHDDGHRGDWKCKAGPAALSAPAALPVFELLCKSVFHFQPGWLPGFLELAQKQQGCAGLGLNLASSQWGFPGGRGAESSENNVPLYKRALRILSSLNPDRNQHQDLEVELLLVSERPNAILQALRILMGKQQWEWVTQVAQQFCKQSPLLNKEIFTTLLCEVAQHRDLDPYLDMLWTLCPEDFTVTTILNLVLKNLPSPNAPSHSDPFSLSCPTSPAPFVEPPSSHLTIGPLKPLLQKVLQRETKPSQRYADILQSPSYPPPAPPRQPAEQPRSVADSAACRGVAPTRLAETPEQQPPMQTAVRRARVPLPANSVGFT